MRSKIRAHIIAIFITPLIIAGIFVMIAFFLFNFILSSDWHLQSDERYTIDFIDSIGRNIEDVGDVKQFDDFVRPNLEKYKMELQITDINENVLYTSNPDLQIGKEITGISEEGDKTYIFSSPVMKDNMITAWVNIIKNKDAIKKIKYQNIIIVVIYMLGFGIMIFLMLVYLKRFTLKFIKTVEELKNAADQMAVGNFDFEVQTYSDDELGEFCKYFNRMKDELNETLQEKEMLEESRKEMIAAISHDLRTPLTTIKAYVEGLQYHMGDDPEKFELCLDVIQNKITRLDRLIEDLFQYSLCQVGKYDISKEIVTVGRLLNELQSEYKIIELGESVEFQVPESIKNIELLMDLNRMKQVMDNLIMNAVYYSKEEKRIVIGAKSSGESLTIYVSDNGIGIKEEDLPNVFERFYRCEKSRHSQYGGMGLGLAICKYIVEAHGGDIKVNSEVNVGSTFSIVLPID